MDRESGKLRFEIALGPKGRDVQKFLLNPGEGIAGWVAMHGRSVSVNDTDTDSRFYPDISKSIGYPTYSMLAVPMRVRDETVGVIEILNRSKKSTLPRTTSAGSRSSPYRPRWPSRTPATSRRLKTRSTTCATRSRLRRAGTIS